LPVLAGCSIGDGDDGDDGGGDPTQDNIDEYEALRVSLEMNRQEVLPATGTDSVSAVGPYLLWLDINQGWEAILHIRRYPEGTEIVSPVPIGDEMTPPFYRADGGFAMTALTVEGDAVYSVIDLHNGALIDEVSHTKPQSAKYDAYGVFDGDAYLVAEDEGKMIYRWAAGTGSPTAIGSIDDTGANLGAWIAFTLVEFGGSLKLVALGTLGTYTIDLDTMAAKAIPLPIAPLEFGITDVGIAAIDGSDLWFYAWDSAEVRAIHDELESSDYNLNSTFANAHWVGSGGANVDVSMDGSTIYYNSVAGIYSYDVVSAAVTPVLLDDQTYSGSSVSIHYTGINVSDGALTVIGLESTSGATGSDGPIYRVAL